MADAPSEAGWPGLLIDEAHGGAGLDAFDAMLVLGECGRVLAGVPLLGHLPATAILDASPNAAELRSASWPPASGVPPTCPRCPPTTSSERWSTDPRARPRARRAARGAAADEDGQTR